MAVQGLFENPGVKRVLLLPSPAPPLKKTTTPLEDRVAMTRLCFEEQIPGLPRLRGSVSIEHSELSRAEKNPHGPTYTFDTLLELKNEIPKLAFVIGTDQLIQLPRWHRFPELLDLCHWIVLNRQGQTSPHSLLSEWEASGLLKKTQSERGFSEWENLILCPTPAPAVSSTQIRENFARKGVPPEKTLTPNVERYLMQRGIYGTSARTSSSDGK